MRRARAARRSRAPSVKTGRGQFLSTTAGVGGGDLAQAAEEIADGAREIAGTWSPGKHGTGATVRSIRVEQVDDNTVNIVADSGAAYPAETRSRHPLFGDREHWYPPPGTVFLRAAADQRADAAAARFGQVIDRKAREKGWAPQ